MEQETYVPVIVHKAEGHDSIIMQAPGNPEMGAIQLKSEEPFVNEQGFFNPKRKAGLFKGRKKDLEKIVESKGLREGDDFSKKVYPVKLVVKEQTQPFYDGQDPKINPSTGEVITSNGQTVYRQTFVMSKSIATADVTLPIDSEEVRAPSVQEKEEEETSFQK